MDRLLSVRGRGEWAGVAWWTWRSTPHRHGDPGGGGTGPAVHARDVHVRRFPVCLGSPAIPRIPHGPHARTRAHPRAHGIGVLHLLPHGSSSHPRPRWVWSRRLDVAIHTVLLRERIVWIDGLSSSVGRGSDLSISRSVPSNWVSRPLLSEGLKGTNRPMERDER